MSIEATEVNSETANIPGKICGISTVDIYRAVEVLNPSSDPSDKKANKGELTAYLQLLPLLQLAAGREERLTMKDIKPYLPAISQLFPEVNTGMKLARTKTKAAIGKKVEEKVLEVRSFLGKAGPYVRLIGQFENPREQYLKEITSLARTIFDNIMAYCSQETDLRNPAGKVIRNALDQLVEEQGAQDYPLIHSSARQRGIIEEDLPLIEDLEIVSPEIVKALGFVANDREIKPGDGGIQYEALSRKLAWGKSAKRFFMPLTDRGDFVINDFPRLLQALAIIMPEDGAKFIEEYNKLKKSFST